MLGFESRTSSAMCQAIASPSRSGSGARYTRPTSPAAFLISARTFFLPSMTSYSGWKSCSMSMPMFFLGRSLTCPTDAFTTKPRPRYFLIVFAFAGDSTMTSALSLPRRGRAIGFFAGASDAVATVAAAFFLAGLFNSAAGALFLSAAGFAAGALATTGLAAAGLAATGLRLGAAASFAFSSPPGSFLAAGAFLADTRHLESPPGQTMRPSGQLGLHQASQRLRQRHGHPRRQLDRRRRARAQGHDQLGQPLRRNGRGRARARERGQERLGILDGGRGPRGDEHVGAGAAGDGQQAPPHLPAQPGRDEGPRPVPGLDHEHSLAES